jgi:hypothetical protein
MIGASTDAQPLLDVQHLRKYFPIQKGVTRRVVGHVRAVDDVSFAIREGARSCFERQAADLSTWPGCPGASCARSGHRSR